MSSNCEFCVSTEKTNLVKDEVFCPDFRTQGRIPVLCQPIEFGSSTSAATRQRPVFVPER